MNKYYNDQGQVGVILSSGWGAGWSTWNPQYPDMLFDKDIIELLLEHATDDQIVEVAKEKYPEAYLGGVDGLTVMFLAPGTAFMVQENDGSESVMIRDKQNWEIA